MSYSADLRKNKTKKMFLKVKVMHVFIDYILEVQGIPEEKADSDDLYFAASIAYKVFMDSVK